MENNKEVGFTEPLPFSGQKTIYQRGEPGFDTHSEAENVPDNAIEMHVCDLTNWMYVKLDNGNYYTLADRSEIESQNESEVIEFLRKYHTVGYI